MSSERVEDKAWESGEGLQDFSLYLCDACSALASPKSDPVSIPQLEASCTDCRMSEFLVGIINCCTRNNERAGDGRLQMVDWTHFVASLGRGMPTRLQWKVRKRGFDATVSIELDIVKKADLPNEPSRVGLSKESIATARSWIQECAGSSLKHEDCRDYVASCRPTRLLQIAGVEPHLRVRLLHEKEYRSLQSENELRYVALSHCWGSVESTRLKTTQETLKAHEAGIAWADIPLTFQDAIIFTHRLGVHYIWIDSLCIIQDDLSEWHNEAGLMCHVYAGSYFTIAAANAAGSEAGLFQEIAPEFAARPYLDMEEPSVDQSHVLYAKRISNYEVEDQADYPLMSRAWAYQERYLSPRVIYFLEGELGWSCKVCADDESKSWSFSSFVDARARHAQVFSKSHVSKGLVSHKDLICHWQRIVGEFSALDLSFEKDRLPAIAGMAEMMKAYRQTRYLAGLWEDSLLVDMTWRNVDDLARRPSYERAPSWSWASIDGEVDFWVWLGRHTIEEVAFIFHVSLNYHDAEESGKVSGGSLKISGPLTRSISNGEMFADAPSADGLDTGIKLFYLHLCHSRDKMRANERGENVYVALRRVEETKEVFKRIGLARSPGALSFDPQTIRTITII